jgi:lipopolysaccharide biosynthesis glycosyltransferase
LRPLYDVDISDACAAVVEDVVSTRGNKKTYDKLCSNLGVNRYFNAGVLLLNLKKLRDDGVEGKCFAFIENERDRIVFWDQCVLNYVLKNKVLFLADVYNFQYNPRHHDMDKIYNSRKDDVVIVHFVGPLKPWDDGFLGSVKEEYVCYYPVYFRWFYRYAGYAQKSAIISRVFAQKVFWRIWMTLRLLMYTLLMNQFRGCIMVAVDIDRARKK